jgi:hypothetical protein
VKKLALVTLVLALALPALAQTPEPEPPAPAPPPPAKPGSPSRAKFFFGGSVGAAFGTVDYIELAPLVGVRIAPRFELGVQPFYRWIDDGRYSPKVITHDYGARVFGRARIVSSLFAEADYQYTNYEYPLAGGGTTRSTHNAFLAGAGYTVRVAQNAGVFFSALYDFTYNANDPYRPYDSPLQFQVGAAIGF